MVWITRFRVHEDKVLKQRLIQLCKKIMVEDNYFGFNVGGSVSPYVDVISYDKKQAFRRGMWIKEHLDEKDLYFKVFNAEGKMNI